MQVNALVKCQSLIKQLVQLLQFGSSDVKQEICFIFANIGVSGKDDDVLNVFKDNQLIRCFVDILDD
jgi:hypothetical protein